MSTEKFQAQAVLCLSNHGGIAIELSSNGEAIRYQWYDKKPSRWCRIRFNQKGEHYFIAHGRRFYLSEFQIIRQPLKFN